MSKEQATGRATETWDKIVELLHDKMQYGFLEQVKTVVQVQIEGSELQLTVTTPEARDFFNSSVNQHRLALLVRPVITLEKVSAAMVEANPLR